MSKTTLRTEIFVESHEVTIIRTRTQARATRPPYERIYVREDGAEPESTDNGDGSLPEIAIATLDQPEKR